jgi:hypothetical protein
LTPNLQDSRASFTRISEVRQSPHRRPALRNHTGSHPSMIDAYLHWVKENGQPYDSSRAPARHHPNGGEADTSSKILSYEEGVVAEAPAEGPVPVLQQNPGLSGKLQQDPHRPGRDSLDVPEQREATAATSHQQETTLDAQLYPSLLSYSLCVRNASNTTTC